MDKLKVREISIDYLKDIKEDLLHDCKVIREEKKPEVFLEWYKEDIKAIEEVIQILGEINDETILKI